MSQRQLQPSHLVFHRTAILLAFSSIIVVSVLGCVEGTTNTAAGVAPKTTTHPNPFGRSVTSEQRWAFSDPKAVQDLQGTTFGEQEINEFWTRKGWKLLKREETYFATLDALSRDGFITKVSRWAKCPYNPIYQALVGVDVLGVHIQPGQEFNLDMCDPEAAVQVGKPRFVRAKTYEEDHAEGHSSDTAK